MEELDPIVYAENALTAAILSANESLSRIPETLQGADFESPSCRTIYKAARELAAAGQEIIISTVSEWAVQNQETFDLQAAMDAVQQYRDSRGVEEYARIVHENGLRRKLQKKATQLSQDKKTPLAELQKQVDELTDILSQTARECSSTFETVDYEEPRFLVEPYFPMGKGTLVQADPGTGKTALICALAAAVSTGGSFMGQRVRYPGDVVMLSTEDDMGILRGRLEANGGDIRRIHYIHNASSMNFSSPEIEQTIRKYHARLVVFDPMQTFLGKKVDMHRANETRPVLSALFDMCSRHDCACVIIAHLGKVTQGKSIVTQSLGSVDIPGVMRSILHVARNPELEGELLAFHVKASNAPRGKTIAFSIVDRGGVEFHGYSDMQAEELTVQRKKQPASPYETEPLVQVFNQMLTDYPQGGFWSYDDLREAYRSIIGSCPYESSRELRTRLDQPGFANELMQKDSIRLTVGVAAKHSRGIRLERYRVPDNYQAKLP